MKKFWIWMSITLVLGLSLILGGLHINFNYSSYNYSKENMLNHVKEISKEPHSIYDQEAIERVRQYITSELDEYGVDYVRENHGEYIAMHPKTKEEEVVNIENIYVDIPGKSGTYILLMAHYDSSPYKIKYGQVTDGSHGAMDDGYGVATLLELARVFANQKDLENGIKLVFFDGEEVHLDGSYALVDTYSDWLDNVNFVVNVEGRGNRGPIYLYRTSYDNSKVIKFFKNAGFPFAFSLASDIFGILPNSTDFSPFLYAGYTGVDMAVIDGLRYYHTQDDNYENIDKAALANYCDMLLPLLEEYTENPEYKDMNYFKADTNSIFFTLFPNVVIDYTVPTSEIIFIVLTVLFAASLIIAKVRSKYSIFKVGLSTVLCVPFILISGGLGYLISYLLALAYGYPFNIMFLAYIKEDFLYLVLSSFIIIALGILVYKLHKKADLSSFDMLISGNVLLFVMYAICSKVLPGGSFVFALPLLLSTFVIILNSFDAKWCKIPKIVVSTIASALTIYMYGVMIYSVFAALTFGSLLILLALTAIAVVLVIPYVMVIKNEFVEEKKAISTAK